MKNDAFHLCNARRNFLYPCISMSVAFKLASSFVAGSTKLCSLLQLSMKFLYGILLFLVAIFAVIICAVEEDEGVLILNMDNFQQVLNDNKHVFVMFYAEWCYYSTELAPEFAKLPRKLSDMNSTIKVGKVEDYGERNLLKRNHVSGFPTLKFFSGENRFPVLNHGRSDWNSVEYDGDYDADAMISWLLEQAV